MNFNSEIGETFPFPTLNSKRIINDKDDFTNTEEIIKEKTSKNSSSYYISGNKEELKQFFHLELYYLEYLQALKYDKRTFLRIYWEILKREQRILFITLSLKDYNILYVKLSRFVFLLSSDIAFNFFFFTDNSINKLYLNENKYDFKGQLPYIICSAIISNVLDILLCYLTYTDKYYYYIKLYAKETNIKHKVFEILKCIKIKLFIFFIIIFVFYIFYWYIVTAFCAVFPNTQVSFIVNGILTFVVSLIYPFIIYMLPAFLRRISLRDRVKKSRYTIYKLSRIIPIF